MSIHSFSALISGVSVAGYLAYSSRGESSGAAQVGARTLKAFGVGLATYGMTYASLSMYQLYKALTERGPEVDNRILNSPYREDLLRCRWQLVVNNLGAQENINALIESSPHFNQMTNALINLSEAGILTGDNRDSLRRNPEKSLELSFGLLALFQENRLTGQSRTAIELKSGRFNLAFFQSIGFLRERNDLDEKIFSILLNLDDDDFIDLVRDLLSLNRGRMRDNMYLTSQIAKVIKKLQSEGALSPDNLRAALAVQEIEIA